MKGADGCNIHVVGGAVSLNAVGGAVSLNAVGGAATGCMPEWSLVVGVAQVYAYGIT